MLERQARDYLQRADSGTGQVPLGDDDRKWLAAIRNRAVMLATISGTISGLIIGGVEIWLRLGVLNGDERAPWDDPWLWAGFYAFVALLTVMEIVFLYWNALNAIVRIGNVVGLAMSGDPPSGLVATGLARSALEIPNPHKKIYGIDPYDGLPRWRLYLWNLLYKAKVGVTSFVLRILMRRVLARAVLRGYVPLLAVPLYAVWNAWITLAVMREARLRALGPYGVNQIVEDARARDDDKWRRAVVHGIGEMVRRGGDSHPNYVLLLSRLVETFAMPEEEIEVDWGTGRSEAAGLDGEARRDLAEFVTRVAVLAGKPNRSQRRLIADLHEIAGRRLDSGHVTRLRHALLDGRPFDGADG